MFRTFAKHGALALLLCLGTTTAAQAGLEARFDEGAPKDRFSIQNTGSCPITQAAIVLDLSTSEAGLVFDVTGEGAGVEVYQPLEIVDGRELLTRKPKVADGDTAIRLNVDRLGPGEAISFTIDVDDTRGQRAITVSGQEVEGVTLALLQANRKSTASFSSSAVARIAGDPC